MTDETITDRRVVDEIRADLAKRHEQSGPFPASGVQMALGRLANDVEGLLAENERLRESNAYLDARVQRADDAEDNAWREAARLRGVVQAVREWANTNHGGSKTPADVWPGLATLLAASLPVPTEAGAGSQPADPPLSYHQPWCARALVGKPCDCGIPGPSPAVAVPTEPTTGHVRPTPQADRRRRELGFCVRCGLSRSAHDGTDLRVCDRYRPSPVPTEDVTP